MTMDGERGAIPDRSAMMRMATAYLARYAASTHRVRQVLERRIRRRCRTQGLEPPDHGELATALDEVLARLVQLGLLDDGSFAASRARALQRKGLPDRRIRMALRSEGLSRDAGEDGGGEVDDAVQARRFAARKRLGPHRLGERAPFRDKDIRSLLRAGFSFSVAAAAIDAEPDAER